MWAPNLLLCLVIIYWGLRYRPSNLRYKAGIHGAYSTRGLGLDHEDNAGGGVAHTTIIPHELWSKPLKSLITANILGIKDPCNCM